MPYSKILEGETMKLTKLSLAALIAVGALTTNASAQMLEEAIKGVETDGYMRYRYTSVVVEPDGADSATKSEHEYKGVVNLKTPVQNGFQAGMTLLYLNTDVSGDSTANVTTIGSTDSDFRVKNFWGSYTLAKSKTTFTAGKQTVGSFLTDDMSATGLKVTNQDVAGVTFAAVAFDSLQQDGDFALRNVTLGDNPGRTVGMSNVYAVAAIGAFGPVGFQGWYHMISEVADSLAAELSYSADMGGTKVKAKGQYVATSMEDKVAGGAASDGDFMAIQAGASVSIVDLCLGYVAYEADTVNGADGTSFAAIEDEGKLIRAGEQLSEDTDAFTGENTYFFAKATVKIPGVEGMSMGLDYASKEADLVANDVDSDEVVLRAAYKFNKNLNLKSYYSMMEVDSEAAGADFDSNKFRFEAMYSF